MKKRLLSILLMCCMVLTLLPTAAFAEGSEEELPVCTCETSCTVESMNDDCPVCGAEGASAENCAKYLLSLYTFVRGPEAQIQEDTVEEQFTLTPGGTYYFDLYGENIPGTANGSLPDASLHYVPFTYAGTVNAYKLTTEMAPFLQDVLQRDLIDEAEELDDDGRRGQNRHALQEALLLLCLSAAHACASGSSEKTLGMA